MIGFSRATFICNPARQIAPTSGITAELSGTSVGDTRTVNLIVITNSKAVAVGIEIEQESNPVPVSATIQPGQTVMLPLTPIATYWNSIRPIARGWDGLNIRWKEPA